MVRAFMQTPCPKCGRLLPQSGDTTVEDQTFPVFQCDECLTTVDIGGAPFEIALTFALDDQGRPFDPASPDGSLPE
jgi:hypothetical protein